MDTKNLLGDLEKIGESLGGYVEQFLELFLTQWAPRIVEFSQDYPATVIVIGVAVLIVAAVAGQMRGRSPRGPYIGKRRVGPLKVARFVRRGRIRRFFRWLPGRIHYYGLLARRYAGEFAIIISGTNSGKTMTIVVAYLARVLLERRRSLIVIDPKGNLLKLLRKLLGRLSGSPPVYLLSTLAKHLDEEVAVLNPFGDRESRMEFIATLIPDPPNDNPVWTQNARHMLNVICDILERMIREQGLSRALDIPLVYDVLKDPAKLDRLAEAYPELRGVWAGQENKTHESVRTNAIAPFEGLENPRVRRIFDSSRAATAEEAAGPTFARLEIAWLCIGAEDLQIMGPLAAAITDYLKNRATSRPEGAPEVEMVIEEAGTCFPNHKLDKFVNYAREAGVRALLVYQDYNQLQDDLGEHKAGSVVGAMEVQIFGPTRSIATAKLVEELSGTVPIQREQPRAMPSFIDSLFGDTRTEPRRIVEREEPRIRRDYLYNRLKRGQFLAFEASRGRHGGWELVGARLAQWSYYSWLIVPWREQSVNYVRPTYPEGRKLQGGAYTTEQRSEEVSAEPSSPDNVSQQEQPTTPSSKENGSGPLQPRECRMCGFQSAATAESCTNCGAGL